MQEHDRKRRGRTLLLARLAKGMTLRDVAAECARLGCPVDASHLNKAERGQPTIGTRKLPVLAEVLGLSIEDLVPDNEAA